MANAAGWVVVVSIQDQLVSHLEAIRVNVFSNGFDFLLGGWGWGCVGIYFLFLLGAVCACGGIAFRLRS